MSLLQSLYKQQEKNGRTGSLLSEPFIKYFSLDINNITKEQNYNSSVFWNLGDPESTDNEFVSPNVVESTVKHTYLYAGTYHITCIVNINGVLFHLEEDLIVI